MASNDKAEIAEMEVKIRRPRRGHVAARATRQWKEQCHEQRAASPRFFHFAVASPTILISLSELVDDRPVARLGNRFAALLGGLEPGRLGDLHFANSLFGSLAAGGAEPQVRNVGDVAAILFAVEAIDVVVFYSSSLSWRLYCSTNSRNCLIWYGTALPFRS